MGLDVDHAGQTAVVVDAAVSRLARQLAHDPALVHRFARLGPEAVGLALRRALVRALLEPRPSPPVELIELARATGLTVDDHDRLGHYVLTTLLALRPGPDALIRVGAALTRARPAGDPPRRPTDGSPSSGESGGESRGASGGASRGASGGESDQAG